MKSDRIRNKNFYNEYEYFNEYLARRLNVEENGVEEYLKRMKNAVIEVKDVLPEWDPTIERLQKIKGRYEGLKDYDVNFDEYQGKDEDYIWIEIFMTKLDANSDPLSKYSKLKFTYKKRKRSLLDRIRALFS